MISINPKLKEALEWLYCIAIAIILALLVRHYIGTPTIVQQPSMFPTLKENQRLWLNRWIITTKGDLQRGDIITFEAPSEDYIAAYDVDTSNPVAIYNNEPKGLLAKFNYYILEFNKKSYIKRIIALEGEHVKIENGKVYINGKELQEDYLQEDVTTNSLNGAYTDLVVPEGYVFVMGDNREHSTDSRRFGCVPLEKIESKVGFRFWPLDLFGHVD